MFGGSHPISPLTAKAEKIYGLPKRIESLNDAQSNNSYVLWNQHSQTQDTHMNHRVVYEVNGVMFHLYIGF